MPLTVAEVSAAPGPARPRPLPVPGSGAPRLPAGGSTEGGGETLVENCLPNREAGGGGGSGITASTCHPSKEGGVGWGGGLQVGFGGGLPESRLLGIRMRQRDLVAPSFQLRK